MLKVKDWAKQKNGLFQFIPLESITSDKIIICVKRLKDDKIFSRGDHTGGLEDIAHVCQIIKFHEDNIHVTFNVLDGALGEKTLITRPINDLSLVKVSNGIGYFV